MRRKRKHPKTNDALGLIKRHISRGEFLIEIIRFLKRAEALTRALRHRAEKQLLLSRREDEEGEEWKKGGVS